MKAYSMDLRQRVVSAVEVGEGTIAQVAARFQVGQTFVKKMLRQWRERGDLTPRPHGGGAAASLGTQHLQKLAQQVKKEPDATLEELRQFLGETAQVRVSEATGGRALQRLPLARKKRA
jgi:transposase